MNVFLFYISILIVWIVFLSIILKKPIGISVIMIGIVSATYSLVYDVTLGEYFGLYYYIDLKNSVLYMILGALFLYPVLNMIYAIFLPHNRKTIIAYTFLWIICMLFFEYITILTKTIVFTGWKPIPWSIITYILTYYGIYTLYNYINTRIYKKHIT